MAGNGEFHMDIFGDLQLGGLKGQGKCRVQKIQCALAQSLTTMTQSYGVLWWQHNWAIEGQSWRPRLPSKEYQQWWLLLLPTLPSRVEFNHVITEGWIHVVSRFPIFVLIIMPFPSLPSLLDTQPNLLLGSLAVGSSDPFLRGHLHSHHGWWASNKGVMGFTLKFGRLH